MVIWKEELKITGCPINPLNSDLILNNLNNSNITKITIN